MCVGGGGGGGGRREEETWVEVLGSKRGLSPLPPSGEQISRRSRDVTSRVISASLVSAEIWTSFTFG